MEPAQSARSDEKTSSVADAQPTSQITAAPPSQNQIPARERRKPKIADTPPPPAPPPLLRDYEPIIGRSLLDELHYLAGAVRGKTVKMVNSTAVGGGVAEMLNRLVPMLSELEVHTGWEVITGGNDFFEVTKAFHNALHGAPYELTQSAKDVFMLHNEQNRQRMRFDEDVVIIHDPQPAGLIASKADHKAKRVWRCHIDLSNPNPDVWAFLRPMIERYDATVFSSPAFAHKLSVPQYLFYPCIDPLSEKNKELEESYVQAVCENFGIDRSRPIVTQISRFDRLKDPLGVIRAYQMAKKYVDLQLVLAGGGASDDPEGNEVLQEVTDAAGDDPDVFILNLPPWSALEINALQRASTLIVQKSLREGFGLTVTEALWKGKATIGSAVGGIPTQIVDRMTGVLVHSVEGCAYQMRYLLTHPGFARKLGENGREHVKENFLMTTNVRRWLMLLRILLGAQ
jgi:trehalose synthase